MRHSLLDVHIDTGRLSAELRLQTLHSSAAEYAVHLLAALDNYETRDGRNAILFSHLPVAVDVDSLDCILRRLQFSGQSGLASRGAKVFRGRTRRFVPARAASRQFA